MNLGVPTKDIIIFQFMENSFGKPIIPSNEMDRLKSLRSFEILQSLPETEFDNIVTLIAALFRMPIALISLVDSEAVFFKANFGMPEIDRTPRGVSLCSLAIMEKDVTIFADTLKEPCLLSNPLVAGAFGLRFYAGAPLTTEDGYNIGTVCVIDKVPREFSEAEYDLLDRFAKSIMKTISLRKQKLSQLRTSRYS
jgi:GAF domain-containing protein